MARAKKKQEPDVWAYYDSIQLTAEEKAAARAEMKRAADRARAEGVYERLVELRGKVKWSVSWEDLRKEDEQ
jgi:hypothetical protein